MQAILEIGNAIIVMRYAQNVLVAKRINVLNA